MSTPTGAGKVALITGVTGQDGIYLSELLLAKGGVVHGLHHRETPVDLDRLERLRRFGQGRFHSVLGDLTDGAGLAAVVEATRPDELYNLAAQSHVQASYDRADATFATNSQGLKNLIEAICAFPSARGTRLFQASSAEIFGRTPVAAREDTPFAPDNPYAEAKVRAHQLVVEARKTHGLHASNGILFNHESPLRGEAFVTRKITRGVAAIHCGRQDRLTLGSLDARRDWGHARDYVDAMWRMLQQDHADDYVIATGVSASPREFLVAAFERVGIQIQWRGEGLDERGVCAKTGRHLVEVDPRFFRPGAPDGPVGDASRARERLGWTPKVTWRELCCEMVDADLALMADQRPAGPG